MKGITEIGFISKNHGFEGSLKVHLEAPLITEQNVPEFYWIYKEGKPVPFKVLECNVIDKENLLITFEDITNEAQAKLLKNEKLFLEDDRIDHFFDEIESYDYLIGLQVIDIEFGNIGIIEGVLENENSHANLVVRHKEKEVLIPFVDEFIEEINNQEVITNLPNGLLELYLEE